MTEARRGERHERRPAEDSSAATPMTPLRRTDGAEGTWEDSLWAGIAVFRWAAWAWMALVAAADLGAGGVAHPEVMVVLVATALAVTVAATLLLRQQPAALCSTPWLAGELALGATLLFADWWVYGPNGIHSQSLGSVWPLAGVLAVGVRAGPLWGTLAGTSVGVASLAGEVAFLPDLGGSALFGLAGTIVLYALGGGVAGVFARRLRAAAAEVAMARAREEVARTLHDGVLQTLAVIQRRSTDTELTSLAREQEADLREFLFTEASRSGTAGSTTVGSHSPVTEVPTLVGALRTAATRATRLHGLRVDVAAVPGLDEPPEPVVRAVAAAVGECLTNAAKHGAATRATVFVDIDDPAPTAAMEFRAEAGTADSGAPGLLCTVKDDGSGFDPATVPEGAGLRLSVRARLSEVGGRVTIESRPGSGTEICLHVPATTTRRWGGTR
ncbi:MAG: hypothetical protein JJU45_20005 [Acidimicrobiia bacterium]|nr:hypothetical protein [Acidimicrobiia bacterium]MCC5954379.1 hypothetical protein [Acidimicrobiia bacterium]